MAERGFIFIADITGYTAFLHGSELEHARGTLTDLLELLINHTNHPLVISRLEGDAVISYALDVDHVTGQTFLEMIEDTYVAFRRAINLMVLNNTCKCSACANVSNLDLKFFLHHGEYSFQRLGDFDELIGTDVNLIHRLTKNTVADALRSRAYLLCTEEAIEALGMLDASAPMTSHTEVVDDFGEVRVWVEDMHPKWEARKDEATATYTEEEVMWRTSTDIPLPPHVVWEAISDPELRALITSSDRIELANRTDGRIGTDSAYVCYHGSQVRTQTILEWRPFERVLFVEVPKMPGPPADFLGDFRLTATESGTRLDTAAVFRSKSRWQRLLMTAASNKYRRRSDETMARFRDGAVERYGTAAATAPLPPGVAATEAARALERPDTH